MKKFFILLFIIISCSSDSSDAEIIITIDRKKVITIQNLLTKLKKVLKK